VSGGDSPGPAAESPDSEGGPGPSASTETDANGAVGARRSRRVAIVAVLALAGLGLAFFVGTRIGNALRPSTATPYAAVPQTTTPPEATATDVPAHVPTHVPTGSAAPGVVAWNKLGGGECLDQWSSPWDREFTVVPCGQPHHAQLVLRGTIEGEPGTPYPSGLAAELNPRCTSPARASSRPSWGPHVGDSVTNQGDPSARDPGSA
jgi:hypothetical protein